MEKAAQKNAREKKRVEVVATAYKQLWAALGADENRRRTMKFETLQVAIQFIHDLKELVGLQLLSNKPSEKKKGNYLSPMLALQIFLHYSSVAK